QWWWCQRPGLRQRELLFSTCLAVCRRNCLRSLISINDRLADARYSGSIMLRQTALLTTLFLTAAVAACSRPEQPSAQVLASAAPAPATAPVASGRRLL